MLFTFFIGFILGAAVVLFILYVIFFDPWGPVSPPPGFIDQFPPIQIDQELKKFLRTGEDGQGVSKWESCFSISLLLHMVFQEHKDTRALRRWLHKRLLTELNDVITRSQAGRLVQDIRILDLSLGTKFPIINNIRVEKYEMSEDKETFEKIHFVVDMDYTGGFETSIGIWAVLGRYAHVSLKVTRLKGNLRLILSRQPYNYWTFSFVSDPLFEFDVKSQIQGHHLKRLIPLITQQIRVALRRKHVWPNYKIRYRPVFPNPRLQPSPPLHAFDHIRLEGGLEVTVLQCTRLQTSLVPQHTQHVIYATCTLSHRPLVQSSASTAGHYLSILLHYHRYDPSAPLGLTFEKNIYAYGMRAVRVAEVVEGSLAEKANFRPGDTIVAINNVPVRYERQVTRQLGGNVGELMVLVERSLEEGDEVGLPHEEHIIRSEGGEGTDSEFVCIGEKPRTREESAEKSSSPADSHRRHSLSQLPTSSSLAGDSEAAVTDSLCSSLHDIPSLPSSRHNSAAVQRTESARVPALLVSVPSVDLRRTRSESQLNVGNVDMEEEEEEVEELAEKLLMQEDEREAPPIQEGGLQMMQGSASAATLEMASSSASLASREVEDEECEEGGLFTRGGRGSTRKRWRDSIIQAKRKVTDFMPAKKKSSASLSVEDVGVDAALFDELLQPDTAATDGRLSPNLSPGGKRTPPDDKQKRKKTANRNESASPVPGGSSNSPGGSTAGVSSSPSRLANSLSTRAVHFSPHAIWGQSLHFQLDSKDAARVGGTPRYLNVTIHARQAGTGAAEEARPVLLGCTSLFVPQLIDDCQLTLSNAHREVFHLMPPSTVTPESPSGSSLGEFGRHAGYDARLCYGDVTLRFRYFPSGLPMNTAINPSCDLPSGEMEKETWGSDRACEGRGETSPSTVPLSTLTAHQWKPVNCNKMCASCRGKIWFKQGLACKECLLITHYKCASKAESAIACTPPLNQDDAFEELRREIFGSSAGKKESSDTATDSPTDSAPEQAAPPGEKATLVRGDTTDSLVSRRAKIKSKVSEKFSSWRKKRNDKGETVDAAEMAESSLLPESMESVSSATLPSPTSSVASIESALSDILPSLEGSPHIADVFFQPGNAYNEETIANAKQLGRKIFGGVDPILRREKINEQIDKIHDAIKETKECRLTAMVAKAEGVEEGPASLSGSTHSAPSTLSFEALDKRMQALAVLMLHYCAALQDCNEASEGDASSLRSSDSIALSSTIQGEEVDEGNNTLTP